MPPDSPETPHGHRPPDPRIAPPSAPPPASAPPPGPAAPVATGHLVGGRYRLQARLGSGGMGTVWRAVDEVIGRAVAIKEPRVSEYLSEVERAAAHERMRREAKAAAGIAHPNVVNVFDVAVDDGRPWIVMELVPGRTLADELTEGTLTPERAAQIGLAVLEALGAAHRVGVLHRDVKPANVLLGPDGRVILTDFGIARTEGEQPLTHSNAVLGSPEYIAPERVGGLRPGPPSDLFSLGVLLYEAVEGWSPFRRGTSLATMLAVRDEDVRPPRRAGPLTKLITGLLKKDPAKRPEMAEARRALRAVAPAAEPDGTAEVPGDGDASRPVPWWRRRRNQVIVAAAVAAAVACTLLLPATSPFGDDVPDGYKRYDEPKLYASIAVPDGYRRKLDARKESTVVMFTEPGGAINIDLFRLKGKDDALAQAHEWMESYAAADAAYQENEYNTPSDDGAWVELSNTTVDDSYRFHGSRAGTMDLTYQEWDEDAGEPDATVHRHMEMVLVGKDGWTYDLTAWFPAHGAASRDGAEVYRQVRDHLRIDNL